MPLLNTDQIAQFQTIQASSLHDTCTLRRHIANATDVYGMSTASYLETANVLCGFRVKKSTEVMGNAQVTDIVAELRLPIDTEIDGLDQVTMTKRYGEAITPVTFKVDGTPIRGVSGSVIQLIKATV